MTSIPMDIKVVPLQIVVSVYETMPQSLDLLLSNYLLLYQNIPLISLHFLLIYSQEHFVNYQTGSHDAFREVKKQIYQFQQKVGDDMMIKLRMICGAQHSPAELMKKAVKDMPLDLVVLSSSLETRLSLNFIERLLLNVRQGKQVFVPIAFWKYNISTSKLSHMSSRRHIISRLAGQFAEQWSDHVAFYVSDFVRVWKSLRSKISTVYQLFSAAPTYTIFRSPDPGCVVEYRERHCGSINNTLSQQLCDSQNVNQISSQFTLAKLLLDGGIIN
ncbi:CHPF [Bugula neritina]|uniref:Hexosyltransferase n=1 Tax=Bugula neritina TaxID=10212 RepID=A0A7J7KDY8_BUGNE|nr:CHPF [Bugula neritina]